MITRNIMALRMICSLVLCFILTSGCSGDQKFGGTGDKSSGGGGEAKKQPTTTTLPLPKSADPIEGSLTQTIQIVKSTAATPIDLVWINAFHSTVIFGSTPHGSRQVALRSRTQKFMSDVAAKYNAKITVFSDERSLGHVSLPSNFNLIGGRGNELRIGAMNGWAVFGAALCPNLVTQTNVISSSTPSGFTEVSKLIVCGQTINIGAGNDPIFAGSMSQPSFFRGQLAGALQANSKRVFIYFSDHDLLAGTTALFNSFWPHAKAGTVEKPVLHAFLKLKDTADCSALQKNPTVEAAAKSTGGIVQDICDPNWEANFAKVEQSIVSELQVKYALTSTKKIKSLTLDGVPLAEDKWSVVSNAIVFASGVLTETSKTIVVTFEP